LAKVDPDELEFEPWTKQELFNGFGIPEEVMNVLKIYEQTNRYKKRGKSAAYLAALEIAAWMSVDTLRTGLPAQNQIVRQLKADAGTFDYPHLTAADFRDVAAKARRVILSKKRRG